MIAEGQATIVIKDGEIVRAQLPAGVTVEKANRHNFVLLVAPNTEVKQPISLQCDISELTGWQMRLEKNARCEFVQIVKGQAPQQAMSCQVMLAENSQLSWVTLVETPSESNFAQDTSIEQQKNAFLQHHQYNLGAGNFQHNITISLQAPEANCELHGLYNLSQKQRDNYNILINHNSPHTFSRQLYKGLCADASHAKFRGKVVVQKDAQQIEAHQSNHTLLLDKTAAVDTRPELEIYADDVKCSHGATIGQLDQEALFYLQARGISAARAREMLTLGFTNEVVLCLSPSLRQFLPASLSMDTSDTLGVI